MVYFLILCVSINYYTLSIPFFGTFSARKHGLNHPCTEACACSTPTGANGASWLLGDIGGCNLRQYATYNTNGVVVKVREVEKRDKNPLLRTLSMFMLTMRTCQRG